MQSFLLFLLLFLFYFPFNVLGTNYYVSSDGDDSKDGKSISNAWKSISKINSSMSSFAPGDSILFRAGDTFTGQINLTKSGTATLPIVFASYGTGNMPIISGAESINGWSLCATCHAGVYVADFTLDTIKQIYVNDSRILKARQPNDGSYWDIDIPNIPPSTGFTEDDNVYPDGYWVGATLRYRFQRWGWANRVIGSYSSGQYIFTSSTPNPTSGNGPPRSDYGYYMEDKLELLDQPNEWYYDATAKKIYIMLLEGNDPSTYDIKGSIYDHGFRFIRANNVDYIVIKGIHIKYQTQNAIYLDRSSNNSILNNKIEYTGNDGVYIYWASKNNLVQGNTIENVINNGIEIDVSTKNKILNNNIKKAGLIPGYAESNFMQFSSCGIFLKANADSNYISLNTIDSVGYMGIQFYQSAGNVAEKNIIKKFCLTVDDGAGIYTFGSSAKNNKIRNNFISDGVGNMTATPETSEKTGGVYLDEGSNNNIVSTNTIENCYWGIILNSSDNQTITDNVLYNNDRSITLNDVNTTPKTQLNIFKRNLSYCLEKDQATLLMSTNFNNTTTMASFDSNYYFNPYSYITLRRRHNPTYPSGSAFTDYHIFKNHQTTYESGSNSRSSFIYKTGYQVIAIGSNIIPNPNFNTGTTSWTSSASNTLSFDNGNGIDGGSLKVNVTTFNGGITRPTNLSVTANNYYQLTFSVKSSTIGQIMVSAKEAGTTPDDVLQMFPISNQKQDYSLIFKATRTTTLYRINFTTSFPDAEYWLDNVYFYPVTVAEENTSAQNPIFKNQSDNPVNFTFPESKYLDIDSNEVCSSVTVPAWSSKVLITTSENCSAPLNLEKDLSNIDSLETTITSKQRLKVYPNPAKDHLKVTLNTKDNVHYRIFNQASVLLKEGNFDTSIIISISDLPKGLFYLQFQSEKENF